ncbi:hypothetical protein [Nicoliella lavandulae]|uniref:Uncharacterized protein n=1 Tax=Nicoliella lavandulae TaxID=3082954 RepID=A0ABU8SMM2_9LACO
MNNNEPETRVERYDRHSKSNPNDNQQLDNANNQLTNGCKKKHHYGRWIMAIIAILLVWGIVQVNHQVSELKNTQRKTDTALDKVIKTQGEKIAAKRLPSEVKPQVIKIIQTTPLSELQRAANNESLFNQIATQNDIPQEYLLQAQSAWFNANNQALRNEIANGQLLAAYNILRDAASDNSSSSNVTSSSN